MEILARHPLHEWLEFMNDVNIGSSPYHVVMEILTFENETDVSLNRIGAVRRCSTPQQHPSVVAAQKSAASSCAFTAAADAANIFWHTEVVTYRLESSYFTEDVGTLASVQGVSAAYLAIRHRHRKRKQILVLVAHHNSKTKKITRFSVFVLVCGPPEDREAIIFDPLPISYVTSGNIDLFASFVTEINDGFRYCNTRVVNPKPRCSRHDDYSSSFGAHYAHKSTEESFHSCMKFVYNTKMYSKDRDAFRRIYSSQPLTTRDKQ